MIILIGKCHRHALYKNNGRACQRCDSAAVVRKTKSHESLFILYSTHYDTITKQQHLLLCLSACPFSEEKLSALSLMIFWALSKKPYTIRWNFLWNFHRDQTVELSVQLPRKVPQELNRGTFCVNSTESSTGT